MPRTATWWTGPADAAWLKAAQLASRQHVAVHDGLTLQVSGGHLDFGRIIGGIASGQAPDVLDVGALAPFVTRGVCRPLEPYLASDTTVATNCVPAMWANGTWVDKTYGIPALDHGPELGLFWNDSLVEHTWTAASPPATWDDLCRAGRSLTRMDSSGAIAVLGFDPLDGVGGLLDTARDVTGQDWYDATKNVVTLDNQAFHTYLDALGSYCLSVGIDRLNTFRQGVQPLTGSNESGTMLGKQIALLSGYWSAAQAAALAHDHSWQYAAAWAPSQKSGELVQRIGGRLLVIPSSARLPDDGWALVRFLAGDDANAVFQHTTGRFAATKSFVSGGTWKGQTTLQFYLDSIASATRLASRSNNPVAGYAQVKWEQAVAEVVVGSKSVGDALAAAQTAVDAELKRVAV